MDHNLEPWAGGRFGDATCDHPVPGGDDPPNPLWGNGSCWGCNCVNGTEPCGVAQTCVWFSQGCSIGCEHCDGAESNPNYKDRCGSGKKPTNNDPYFRTVNLDAPAMSSSDLYQHNPWRAPGNAPVYDPCGMAGGSPTWVKTGLSFIDTKFARQGDNGSMMLPPRPTGIVWVAGAEAEAKWTMRANHGGGCMSPLAQPISLIPNFLHISPSPLSFTPLLQPSPSHLSFTPLLTLLLQPSPSGHTSPQPVASQITSCCSSQMPTGCAHARPT